MLATQIYDPAAMCLADDMGLGKTIMTIALLSALLEKVGTYQVRLIKLLRTI